MLHENITSFCFYANLFIIISTSQKTSRRSGLSDYRVCAHKIIKEDYKQMPVIDITLYRKIITIKGDCNNE